MAAKTLTDEQLQRYKEVLEQEKEDTLQVIRDIENFQKRGAKENSGNLSSYSLHQADLGSDTESSEKEVYLLEEEQRKLRKLNQSLKRVYEKSYGICEMCGEYIGEKRLKIVPYASLCIDCRSKEEKSRKRR